MWLKPHDMAKFGWLYLNKGRWGKHQILPYKWVERSTGGQIPATLFDHYGYQWWVDSAGYYMAVGYKGQRIFVAPEKNMVVVFTADLTGRESFTPKKLLDYYIIPAASSSKELTLKCGTQAYQTEIKWLFNSSIPIRTYLVTAYKAGKYVFVDAHPWKYDKKAEQIVQSLTLK